LSLRRRQFSQAYFARPPSNRSSSGLVLAPRCPGGGEAVADIGDGGEARRGRRWTRRRGAGVAGWRGAVCVCGVRRGGRCPCWLAGAPCARREEGGSASVRWPPPLAAPLAREGNAPLRAPRGGCPGPLPSASIDRANSPSLLGRDSLGVGHRSLARSPPPRPEPSSPSTAHDRHELRRPTSTACRPGCPRAIPPRQNLVAGER